MPLNLAMPSKIHYMTPGPICTGNADESHTHGSLCSHGNQATQCAADLKQQLYT